MHCELIGRITRKCPLTRGYEKKPVCDECRWQAVVYHSFKYILHAPDASGELDRSTNPPTWQKIDSGNIRPSLDLAISLGYPGSEFCVLSRRSLPEVHNYIRLNNRSGCAGCVYTRGRVAGRASGWVGSR